VSVQVRVEDDESGNEPIEAEMIWTWVLWQFDPTQAITISCEDSKGKEDSGRLLC
jgi:hypothetical protein